MDLDVLQEIVGEARAAGADAAEAAFARRESLAVSVRLGALEEVEREEAMDLGLRVFMGARQAAASGSDLSREGQRKLLERVVAMARVAPEDPWAGLAPSERLGRFDRELELADPSEPDAALLEARALEAEDAARSVAGVSNSNGAQGSWSRTIWSLVTSGGFAGERRSTASGISAQVVAGEGAAMEQGAEGRATRWLQDLPAPAAIGQEAGRRAAEAVGGRKIASQTAAVIFENRLAGQLLSPFVGAISGPAVARGVSFLKDRLGERVFSPNVTLIDDPHRVRGLGSAPFDDEGVAGRTIDLVAEGVLSTWLMNSSSARQLSLETTGHASRGLAGPPGVGPSNLTLLPGEEDQEGLMRRAGQGILVTSMFGPSLNANTGDWSVGCQGVWFEAGEKAYPVTEITVAGNLKDIYARLIPGSDLQMRRAVNAPSLLIEGLAIAGL